MGVVVKYFIFMPLSVQYMGLEALFPGCLSVHIGAPRHFVFFVSFYLSLFMIFLLMAVIIFVVVNNTRQSVVSCKLAVKI